MGGSAFAKPGPNGELPLYTPRMPHSVHAYLKDQCAGIIALHYQSFATLTDAPEKLDHGDIDFFVQDPISEDAMEKVIKELKAERVIKEGHHISVAIPWPAELHFTAVKAGSMADSVSAKSGESPADLEISQPFAQLDLRHLTPTLSLTWLEYLHSYGDLGQILGYLSYDLGITCNDKGFHVRIKEQERTNWQASLIHLTSDPVLVMNFLGLDPQAHKTGFETINDMFSWTAKSRTAVRYPKSSSSGTTDASSSDEIDSVNQEASTPEPATMKNDSDHSRRMATRTIFARFIHTVLPTLPLLPGPLPTARQQLLDDSLSFFDKRTEYETRLAAALAANADEKARGFLVAALIASSVPPMKQAKANEIVRAVRRCVIIAEGPDAAREACFRDLEEDELGDEIGLRQLLRPDGEGLDEGLLGWILGHKLELRDRERARAKSEKERTRTLGAGM